MHSCIRTTMHTPARAYIRDAYSHSMYVNFVHVDRYTHMYIGTAYIQANIQADKYSHTDQTSICTYILSRMQAPTHLHTYIDANPCIHAFMHTIAHIFAHRPGELTMRTCLMFKERSPVPSPSPKLDSLTGDPIHKYASP